MSFAWPHLLWLLLAPAALLVWQLTHRRRAASAIAHPKILRAEAGTHSLTLSPRPSPSSLGGSAGVRPWLIAGLACSIVALARPQWGRIEEPVFDQSREILLAIDLSRSMLATDVKPSRLDRAKLLIQSLLEKLAGERVGLIVFSGTAFLQSPLSSDYEILREFLPSLDTEFLPQGGSNYAAMLESAVQAFSSSTADRFLIVLSDGESTEPGWRSQLPALKNKDIRVLSLGIGTPAGSMLPDGTGGFVKDERGAVVLSRLESVTLQDLANATNGVYRDASSWVDLAGLVNETIEAGRKGEFVEKNSVRLVERFQWPLALALWCFFVSLCYEFPVRPRPRDLKLARVTEDRRQGTENREQETQVTAPAAVATFSILCLLSSVLCPPSSVRAAATLATPATNTAPLPSPLARIVGRLSAGPAATARDWAELARETVTWGSRLQSEQQSVPEGPVRDALHAVDLGSKEDPKTADWPKLREELEALLKKQEEQQPQKEQQKNQSKDQNKKPQDQNQQQDSSNPQDQQQSQQSQPQNPDQQKQNQPQDQNTAPPQDQPPKPGESAFGDMQEKSQPPPPPPGEMQKVGGAQEKPEPPPEATNPALAVPLQKLDQLRNQDSPARLFELMQGDEKAEPKKPGKDW